MLIFAPIDQTGWAAASAGVATAIRSRCQVRKGPPEAVMMAQRHVRVNPGGQRLQERVVLGVDRDDLGAGLGGIRHEGSSGADEALLVGKRNASSGLDGSMGRTQARRAADGSQHHVGLAIDGLQDGALPSRRRQCRNRKARPSATAPPLASESAANWAPSFLRPRPGLSRRVRRPRPRRECFRGERGRPRRSNGRSTPSRPRSSGSES